MSKKIHLEPVASSLRYDAQTQGPVPIPAAERTLQSVIAEPWFMVSSDPITLEGPCFDRNGDLLFCDVTERKVLRLTAEKKLSVVSAAPAFGPGGLAIHKDGRVFIAELDVQKGAGSIAFVLADGSGYTTVLAAEAGYLPNDIVFDMRGGIYFSDFRGSSTEPLGGLYYMTSEFDHVSRVLPHVAMANGIALSPDGKQLWATGSGQNLLHRLTLDPSDPTKVAPIGTSIPYHFIGPIPDSMRTDTDGNVYVAMNGQGRVLVFNCNGIPIGQILLPGRDEGIISSRQAWPSGPARTIFTSSQVVTAVPPSSTPPFSQKRLRCTPTSKALQRKNSHSPQRDRDLTLPISTYTACWCQVDFDLGATPRVGAR